ncbi:uncharacterized protein CCOS01_09445 [Colletotrichum costaricense]|uniref:Oxidase ustYa n=1 Tax=Colletotrichum costaricense TaxID=1209916 RepID=A0AAI9YUB5_9PEZI|nr:uncharacterized protein CCOS01_09445 [Colletotrichum costaricense]KAK1524358.1 hypothetical protein CCOS01_09445 [Colletotrichum costaricense]
MGQIAVMDSETCREKGRLLAWSDDDPSTGEQPRRVSQRLWAPCIITVLAFSNLLLAALCVCLMLRVGGQPAPETAPHTVATSGPSWLPPQKSQTFSNTSCAAVPMKKTLNSEPIYGGPITNESKEAWDALMPRMFPTPGSESKDLTCTPDGRGFVIIKNETAVPEMPKFNATMSEYKGVISVFHQLHCVWATREAFFRLLRDGNSTEIDLEHLGHCWDFVRQAIQCRADTTIEWQVSDELSGSLGWGYQHQCYDYDALLAWAEERRWGDEQSIH